MKTAISIPDALFEAGEQAARQKAISRSELYAAALKEYLAARSQTEVTARLNEVYAEQPGSLDSAIADMQDASLGEEEW